MDISSHGCSTVGLSRESSGLPWTIWAWGRHGDKCWTLAAWNAMLRFGSVGHGPNMASYHTKDIKRTSKNQGFGVLRGWEMLGAWTACRTARSGEGFEVDVVFDSACLLFHLIHKELSGSIGIMASKSASSSLLHQLETPSSPANSTNKSTTLVICGDKPCQVGSAHFDPHPCTNKIFTTPILGPFSKLFLSTSFNPFSRTWVPSILFGSKPAEWSEPCVLHSAAVLL